MDRDVFIQHGISYSFFNFRRVLQQIIEKIITELFNYYLNSLKNIDLRQKQAFQVLYDIKYCTLLMVPRENKILNELSSKTCDAVLAKIDPFDYDVFNPFIHINIRKSVQRSLVSISLIHEEDGTSTHSDNKIYFIYFLVDIWQFGISFGTITFDFGCTQ